VSMSVKLHDGSMSTNESPDSQSVPAREPGAPGAPGAPDVSETAVRQLARAVAQLNNDSEWFLEALTDYVYSLRPVTKNRLTEAERRYLIESGDFTAEALADAEKSVDRGSLQVDAIEGWLAQLNDTISLDEAAEFLGREECDVTRSVTEGRLYAVEVSGRRRFPGWQFDVRQPGKVLPHLQEVVQAVSSRWESRGIAAFMATPQSGLVARGRKTPAAWLRDGGDVAKVVEIVESDDWW
jgi:hypothetical protein